MGYDFLYNLASFDTRGYRDVQVACLGNEFMYSHTNQVFIGRHVALQVWLYLDRRFRNDAIVDIIVQRPPELR
jgi:hypothetical protein